MSNLVLIHNYHSESTVHEQLTRNTLSTTIINTPWSITIFSIPTSDHAKETSFHLEYFFKIPRDLQITHDIVTTCLLIGTNHAWYRHYMLIDRNFKKKNTNEYKWYNSMDMNEYKSMAITEWNSTNMNR